MKKILFLANHRTNRSPGQRFRFEQYLIYLNENGFCCELSPLLSENDDVIFYSKGNWIRKFFILLACYNKRLKDINKAKEYDIVFVFREAFFTGTTYFERKIAQSNAKLIFDFDDSIWRHDVSEGNKKWGWLKNPDKTKKIIELSDSIFVGNQYLMDYAKMYNSNVKLIPTTIDTNYHIPNKIISNQLCIGWTGSSTTLKYFETLIPVLIKIKEKYNEKVTFKVIVDVEKEYAALGIKTTPWNLITEMDELNKIDIGIMPLPNNKWTEGKCGFKGLQYMALEIPTIMSPVGVNTEIIQNGVNGFLADTDEEWLSILSNLIESENLRNELGVKARETIEKKYSVESQKMTYLNEFNKLISE